MLTIYNRGELTYSYIAAFTIYQIYNNICVSLDNFCNSLCSSSLPNSSK